jgi:hypothetical protein
MAKLIFNVPEQVKVSDFEETSLRERYPCFGADCAKRLADSALLCAES